MSMERAATGTVAVPEYACAPLTNSVTALVALFTVIATCTHVLMGK
jgi:hypothetical protein